jgi:hypothetical protein
MMRLPVLIEKTATRTAGAIMVVLLSVMVSDVDTVWKQQATFDRPGRDAGVVDGLVTGPAALNSKAGWMRLSKARLPGTRRASRRGKEG